MHQMGKRQYMSHPTKANFRYVMVVLCPYCNHNKISLYVSTSEKKHRANLTLVKASQYTCLLVNTDRYLSLLFSNVDILLLHEY